MEAKKSDLDEHQYITDSKGNKSAVILPILEYERLLEELDDIETILERRNDKSFSLEEAEKMIFKDESLVQG